MNTGKTRPDWDDFRRELAALINTYSLDTYYDMSDAHLAAVCINAMNDRKKNGDK